MTEDEEEDVFKFRLTLKPHPSDADPLLEQHKLVIQIIGGVAWRRGLGGG